MQFLLSSPLLKALWCFGDDQTGVTVDLNNRIEISGDCGYYCGWGKGVMIRNPYDGYETGGTIGLQVVPATFWHNDIAAANTVFPSSQGSDPSNFQDYPGQEWGVTSYNVDCPNSGNNGYFDIGECLEDPGTGENSPWRYASTGYVIGDAMANLFIDFDNIQSTEWGWGVFYSTDSNSVDYRCRYLDDFQIYDCPPDFVSGNNWWSGGYIGDDAVWIKDDSKLGTGAYPAGNPYAFDGNNGGGTGCHFDKGGTTHIDQTDAFDDSGKNLVQDYHCQCNWDFNDDWDHWVSWWIAYSTPKPSFADSEYWLGSSGQGAPFRALDQVSCWHNNLKDMIGLQNALWWRRWDWANQMAPQTNWQPDDANSQWAYWGWNEIPMSLDQLTPVENHQAIFIHLPSSICGNGGGDDSVWCLGSGQQYALENDLDNWVNGKDNFQYLVPGRDNIGGRPGSYVVFVREYYIPDQDRWSKWFFCENWQGPRGLYQIFSFAKGFNGNDDDGACFIDWGSNYNQYYGSAYHVGKLNHQKLNHTMNVVV